MHGRRPGAAHHPATHAHAVPGSQPRYVRWLCLLPASAAFSWHARGLHLAHNPMPLHCARCRHCPCIQVGPCRPPRCAWPRTSGRQALWALPSTSSARGCAAAGRACCTRWCVAEHEPERLRLRGPRPLPCVHGPLCCTVRCVATATWLQPHARTHAHTDTHTHPPVTGWPHDGV
jgi:hypothetical protein